jgi:alkylation response protein AidB-like acyl-CoA dehydrogenase
MATLAEPTTGVDADERLVVDRVDHLLAARPPASTPPREFLGAQFDAGLAFVHFPVGHGGLNVGPKLQEAVNSRLRAANAPNSFGRNPIGIGMGAPTVVTHGSEAQRTRYLRPLFTAEEIWCQLFSEPGAGSDVAGLSTRAVRDGDEWIVNGQKVWTTLAHVSRFGMLLARTDPEAPKHRGMTYFVVDMHAPGVEVRPLRQMTGEAEFNEVYFTDVRIPDAERLGDVGAGWHVALTTLMNERVSLGGGVAPRGSGAISDVVRLWGARRASGQSEGPEDLVLRDRVMQRWIEAEVLRLTNIRASQNRKMGTPGPEGSVGKLFSAELNKRVYELCVDLMGVDGLLHPAGYGMTRPEMATMGVGMDARKAFLRSRANSIEGGTSEVMRNILGERVLGLPGDVRADKDLAWSQIPRN